MAASAGAVQKAPVAKAIDANQKVPMTVVSMKNTMATPAESAKIRAQHREAKVLPTALYGRPAGSFYRSVTTDFSTYYAPLLYCPVFRDVTYVNRSVEAENSTWSYRIYNSTAQAYDSIENQATQDLTVSYLNGEGHYAPTVTATNSLGSSSYQLYNDYYNSKTKTSTIYKGFYTACVDPAEDAGYKAYVTPKYFSAGMRDRANSPLATYGGTIYFTGCDLKTVGDGEGSWFGRNMDGHNAMGLYCEKPATPYALRQVGVAYHSLAWADGVDNPTADITVKVYSIAERTDSTLAVGEVLAQGVYTMDTTTVEAGMLMVPLMQVDEDGIESEVVLDVTDQILVVVSGYDNENIDFWTMAVSTDGVDDGYGEMGYMIQVDTENVPQQIRPLSSFFRTPLGYTAPTIVLDVEWPILVLNFDEEQGETGEYNFPAEGGDFARDLVLNGKTYPGEPLYLYSTHSSDEFEIGTEDSDVAPDWLTFEFEDQTDEAGDFSGLVVAAVTAAPLPEGMDYREAKVRIHYPGASLIYTFTQGEQSQGLRGDVNGDGSVGIDDVNMAINMMLGTLAQTAAADLNGDGAIGIDDVNSIINIMLGK